MPNDDWLFWGDAPFIRRWHCYCDIRSIAGQRALAFRVPRGGRRGSFHHALSSVWGLLRYRGSLLLPEQSLLLSFND